MQLDCQLLGILLHLLLHNKLLTLTAPSRRKCSHMSPHLPERHDQLMSLSQNLSALRKRCSRFCDRLLPRFMGSLPFFFVPHLLQFVLLRCPLGLFLKGSMHQSISPMLERFRVAKRHTTRPQSLQRSAQQRTLACMSAAITAKSRRFRRFCRFLRFVRGLMSTRIPTIQHM